MIDAAEGSISQPQGGKDGGETQTFQSGLGESHKGLEQDELMSDGSSLALL